MMYHSCIQVLPSQLPPLISIQTYLCVNCVTWKVTQLLHVDLNVMIAYNVTFVEERIIPHGTVTITTMDQILWDQLHLNLSLHMVCILECLSSVFSLGCLSSMLHLRSSHNISPVKPYTLKDHNTIDIKLCILKGSHSVAQFSMHLSMHLLRFSPLISRAFML